MGSQHLRISRRISHPSYDVAVLQVSERFLMWNWKVDRFVTAQPAITRYDYTRPFYAGTNASMDGMGLLCLGYGGAENQPTLKYGLFNADYPTNVIGWGGVTHVDAVPAGSADSESGDSGGPCLDSINTVTGRLSMILVSAFSTGVGARDWAWWATATILSLR